MDLREIQHLSSAVEVCAVILPSFLLTVISTNLSAAFIRRPHIAHKISNNVILDFVVLVLPVILSCTVLSDHLGVINLVALALVLLFTFCNSRRIDNNEKPQNSGDQEEVTKRANETNKIFYLSNIRSTVNLLTVVCILAVDFPIFPLRFHKTARYGVSLMDVGVGLYVYANGIVACEIRGVTHSLRKTFVNVLPILVIGVLRFVSTYLTRYHVNPQEYGVHWNFFITLAVTKLLSALIMTAVVPKFTSCLLIGTLILSMHQLLLWIGLEEYVFSSITRDNLLDANREGVVSSFGYVGLYFLSVATGFILHNFKNKLRVFWGLFVGNALLFFVTICLHQLFNISRCLANSTYITWILLIAYFMTFLFFAYEQFLNYFYHNRNCVVYAPLLYEAINYNGLTYFLVANLLTGFVNLTIDTSLVPSGLAMLIMVVYMFTCSLIVVFLYVKQFKLKL